MPWPLVSRIRYEAAELRHKEVRTMLEARIDDLQKRFDALQEKSDGLAKSIIESEKEHSEYESDDSIGFAPKISDVRNRANSWAAERFRGRVKTS